MRKLLKTVQKFLYIVILLRFIQATTPPPASTTGEIAIAIPSFAEPGLGIFYRCIYGAWLCLFIFIVMMSRGFITAIQKQVVIFQGIFFGVDVTIYTIGYAHFANIAWIISFIASPVCTVLSINDRLFKTFIALINAFGISYLTAIIVKIASIIKIGVFAAIVYLILIVLISGSEKLQICLSKIFTVTISVVTLIQLSGLINIFYGLHGGNESIGLKILHYGLALIVLLLVATYFISITYFSSWADKKVEEVVAIKNNVLGGEETTQS